MPTLYDPLLKEVRLGETNTLIYVATASASISNSTTETNIIGTGIGYLTLPSHYLLVGKSLLISLRGIYSTQLVAITLRMRVKLGATTILDTGAQNPANNLANRGFGLHGTITCRTVGSSGTVFGQGIFIPSTTGVAFEGWDMENTAATTIDTTATQAITITATWGAGVAAADTITGTNCLIQSASIN